MTKATNTKSVTLFALRYRRSENPDAWCYLNPNTHRPANMDLIEIIDLPCDPQDPLYGMDLTKDAKSVALVVNHLKTLHRSKELIFAVHRVEVTKPEHLELLEAMDNWKQREAARFADGTYTRTIFEGLDWFDALQARDLFIHNSAGRSGFISLTVNSSDGARDRQTRMNVSRFLSRYYRPDESGASVEMARQELMTRWNDHHGLLPDLRFTTDADEIYNVYRNGPRACMSYEPEHYCTRMSDGTYVHPSAVYADGPDLQLAYLVDSTSELDEPRIVARALVWPDKKIFGRTYGDTYAIEALLQAQGYTRERLVGARIRAIPIPGRHNNYVMPYIDDTCCAQTYDDEYHLIAEEGEGDLGADSTNGSSYSIDNRCSCDNCGDLYYDDDMTRVRGVYGVNSWCCYCVSDCAIEDNRGRYYDREHFTQLDDGTGRVIDNDCIFIDEYDGCIYHQDDMHELSNGLCCYIANADEYQAAIDADELAQMDAQMELAV